MNRASPLQSTAATLLAAILCLASGIVNSGDIKITIDGVRITTEIDEAPLGEVLQQLATYIPMTVSIGDKDAEQKVSSHQKDTPLGHLLSQLLRGKSYILTVYQDPAESPGLPPERVAKLVVLADGASATGDIYSAPSYQEPQYEEPVYEEPQYEEPVYEEPQYEEPVYEEPQYEEPAYVEPLDEGTPHDEGAYFEEEEESYEQEVYTE